MKKPLSYLLLGTSCAVFAQVPALAQDAGGNEGGLKEIVVTAQKQAQSQQDVPISVTAVTGESLAAAQVNNVADLANSIPNVQINSFSNSPDSAVVTIRGMGVNDADPYVGTPASVVRSDEHTSEHQSLMRISSAV